MKQKTIALFFSLLLLSLIPVPLVSATPTLYLIIEDVRDDGGYYHDSYVATISGNRRIFTVNEQALNAYMFDKSLFRLHNTSDSYTHRGVYYDGHVVHTADSTDGIHGYSYSDTTGFTLRASRDDGGAYMDLYGGGGYIYVACSSSGLRVYQYISSPMPHYSLIDSDYQSGSYQDVWYDGTYIYVACGTGGLRAYLLSSGTLYLINTINDGGYYEGVWGDGTYIYTAQGASGISCYTLSGSPPRFRRITYRDDGGTYHDVWGDGTYIYTACGTDGLRAYYLESFPVSLSLLDTDDQGGEYTGLWGDSTNIFVDVAANGLYAYSHASSIPTPEIQINFAGNLGDLGGPYCVPPADNDSTGGPYALNGYYTNDSIQSENFMYINLTVTGVVTELSNNYIWLQWKEDNTWTNWTYYFTHTTKDWYEFNTSGNITISANKKYSFDIYVNGSYANNYTAWNKTDTNTQQTRRYVYLKGNEDSANFEYKPFYCYEASYSQSAVDNHKLHDILHHDQGIDGATTDTGYLLDDTPTDTVHTRYCSIFLGYWFDESISIPSITLKTIYHHFWWNVSFWTSAGWNKSRAKLDNTVTDGYTPSPISGTSISYGGYTYNLSCQKISLSNPVTITDNNVYEICGLKAYASNPRVISNRSFTSFVLFNIPSDAVLQTYDTDSDGLNDYQELFTYYTNPFLSDTDNDGYSDNSEIGNNTDPNDYLDYPTGEYIWMEITPTQWNIGTVQMGASYWTNSSNTFTCVKDNCTVYTDLSLQITNDAADWSAATSGNGPGADVYRLNASSDSWSTEHQIVTASDTVIASNIPPTQNQTFDLRFDSPTSSTTGDQQTITITATLAKH